MEKDIVAAIIKGLRGRKGFSWWYDSIDPEDLREMHKALEASVSPIAEAVAERLADAEAAMLRYFDTLERGEYVGTGIAKYLQGRGLIDDRCDLTPKGGAALAYAKTQDLPKSGGVNTEVSR
jgi:CRISPR/Cas system CMR-associated protein Cmr1 (group 7 of RAMP superfamily)